jgi:tetratricopeptide (TPR) repeat protein
MNQDVNLRPSQHAALRAMELRLTRLETEKSKGSLKRFSENAGAVGLTLGLILSLSSLYDVFVRKPAADHINAISQFNQTVNSAAKTRQNLIQSNQGADAAARLALSSMATPRILNDIATARALLPELRSEDVGIPQLLILINESMTAGDRVSAEEFIARAVARNDVPPLQAAEARRYKGKYLFWAGKPQEARAAYMEASRLIGDEQAARSARAFNWTDLIGMEYAFGYCDNVEADVDILRDLLGSQGVAQETRSQLAGALAAQFDQFSGQKCPKPGNSEALRVAAKL